MMLPAGSSAKRLQVRVPLAFGVEQRLVALRPERLHDGLQASASRWSRNGRLEMKGVQPRCIQMGMGTCFARVGAGERQVAQVRHQRLAACQHLFRDLLQVESQRHIAAELVGQDVERSFQHAADGRDRAALRAHALHLRAEGVEVIEHGHAALHKRQVVAVGGGPALGAHFAADARQPRLVEEARGVFDQLVVLLALHERVRLRRARGTGSRRPARRRFRECRNSAGRSPG